MKEINSVAEFYGVFQMPVLQTELFVYDIFLYVQNLQTSLFSFTLKQNRTSHGSPFHVEHVLD
jgi:hypothetical protein